MLAFTESHATTTQPNQLTAEHPLVIVIQIANETSRFIFVRSKLRSIQKMVRVLSDTPGMSPSEWGISPYQRIELLWFVELNNVLLLPKLNQKISEEIITSHPASGHLFKIKQLGDNIAYYD